MKTKAPVSARKGFTLVETIIAIGVIAVLMSIFLTLLIPARTIVRDSLTRQQSENLVSVLRGELSTVRSHELAKPNQNESRLGSYLSPFDKAFFMFQKCKNPGSSLVIFSYYADTSKALRSNGSYPPAPRGRDARNTNAQLVTVVCPMDDPVFRNDIALSVGPAFLVKLTELVPTGKGNFQHSKKPGEISNAKTPSKFVSKGCDSSGTEPLGGVIFYNADFYLLSPPDPRHYRRLKWSNLGSPIFSSNMSFRR